MKPLHIVLGVLLLAVVAGAVWKARQPVVTGVDPTAAARQAREEAAWNTAVAATQKQAAITDAERALTRKARSPLTLTGHAGAVASAAFSPDGKRLASGGADGTVRIWSLPDGKQIQSLKGHTDVVLDVAWSHDGQRLVSSGKDRIINVWDSSTGQLLDRHQESDPVFHTRFLSGDRLVSTAATGLLWWKLGQEEKIQEHDFGEDLVTAMDVAPDGEILVGLLSGDLVRLNGDSGDELGRKSRPLRSLKGAAEMEKDWAIQIVALPDGAVLVDDLSGAWLWDRSGRGAGRITPLMMNPVAPYADVSPDRQVVVMGGARNLQVIDPRTRAILVGTVPEGRVNRVVVSPDGNFCAVATGGQAANWNDGGPGGLQLFDLAAAKALVHPGSPGRPTVPEPDDDLEPWK